MHCNLYSCFLLKQKVVQGIDLNQIRGLGFDATCSLVVLDKQFQPLPVNHEGRTIPLSLSGGGRHAGADLVDQSKGLRWDMRAQVSYQ